MKKITSLVLALTLCVTALCATASAYGTISSTADTFPSANGIYSGTSFLKVEDKFQAMTLVILKDTVDPLFGAPVLFIQYQARLYNSTGKLQLASSALKSSTDRLPVATTGFWEGDTAFSRGCVWTASTDLNEELTFRPLPRTSPQSLGRSLDEDTDILEVLEATLNDDKEYPVNQFGETYGLAILADVVGEEPDLIAAVGIDGDEGYVRSEDLSKLYDVQPDEVVLIPLYDLDGTEIGTFALNSMK